MEVTFIRYDYTRSSMCSIYHVPTSETLSTANRLTRNTIRTVIDNRVLTLEGPGIANPYLTHALLAYIRDGVNHQKIILSILSDVFKTENEYGFGRVRDDVRINGPQRFLASVVHPDLWARKMRGLIRPKEEYRHVDTTLNTVLLYSLGYSQVVKDHFINYQQENRPDAALTFRPPPPALDELMSARILSTWGERPHTLSQFRLEIHLPWFVGSTYFLDDTVRDPEWWKLARRKEGKQ